MGDGSRPLNRDVSGQVISLDSPRWKELRHAYGAATDVPALLRGIAASPERSSPSEGPWYGLWSALCHQGDVYPASFAAVPHVISILAEHRDRACFDFFLLPASIEVARNRHGVSMPADLEASYHESLQRLPALATAISLRPWDPTLGWSVLAAVAAAKSQHGAAELLLEIDHADTAEVLRWYRVR